MSKSRNKNRRRGPAQASNTAGGNLKRWIPVVALLVVAGIVAVALVAARGNRTSPSSKALPQAPPGNSSVPPSPPAPAAEQTTPASELVPMDVAKAVMVTAELDFG